MRGNALTQIHSDYPCFLGGCKGTGKKVFASSSHPAEASSISNLLQQEQHWQKEFRNIKKKQMGV